MKSLKFFATVTLSVISIGVFAITFFRYQGLRQGYAPHNHPLVQTPQPWIVAGENWAFKQTPQTLIQTCQAHPNFWVFVPLLAEAGTPEGELKTSNNKISATDFVKPIGRKCRWIFSLQSNVSDIHKRFLHWVATNQIDSSYAVHSPYEVIVKALKDENPQGLFVSSLREITRLSIASQIGLESVVPMMGDIVIVDPYLNLAGGRKRWVLQENLLDEVHRRKKQFCVGPLDDFAKWKGLHEAGFDCVLTEAPELYLGDAS